ncbi:hypothetical protein J7481_22935 [Labrenzia sp. R4_2]|uniref:hypothetical protein n=1 Tax=Labrenzia sp. R4_2 TaxID=2821107 RepID=UPI001ADA020F|nr:hypothetical protein [Labrenzia sp. R4_2]MBO9422384.1 hypothetical protein [Labrenzia sp. R4_2]
MAVNSAARAQSNPFAVDEPLKSVRGWSIGAVKDNDASFFPNACVAIRDYPSQTRFVLFRSELNDWGFAIFNRGMNQVKAQREYPFVAAIDGRRWTFNLTGLVRDGHHGVAAAGITNQFLEAFMAGRQLSLFHQGRRLQNFRLTGTRAAGLAVEECFAQGRHRNEAGFEIVGSQADHGLATLYDLIVYSADRPVPSVMEFEEGLNQQQTISSMIKSDTIKSVHDCSIEFRQWCHDVLKTGQNGDDVVQEWGEWRDAAASDKAFRRSFITGLVDEAISGGYTILSDREVRFFKDNNPNARFEIPYGSRVGMNMTIIDFGGIGTPEAWIELRHLWRNAKEVCEAYANDFSEDCIRRNISNPYRGEVSANCDTGVLRDLNGIRYQFVGRSDDSFRDYDVVEVASKKTLDGSMASGLPLIIEYYKALCPSMLK